MHTFEFVRPADAAAAVAAAARAKTAQQGADVRFVAGGTTLLDLMNFPASERHREYARSLLTAKATDSQPRYFWIGDLSERILGAKLAFDR